MYWPDLRKPGFEERKCVTVLGGDGACCLCGAVKDNPSAAGIGFTHLCKSCTWHYNRKKYHAVYHYVLRAAIINKEVKHLRGTTQDSRCTECERHYGVRNPSIYAARLTESN